MANGKIYADAGSLCLSIACLICDEPVELSGMEIMRLNHGLSIHSKICQNCKNAIKRIRNEMELEKWKN